MQLKYCLNRHTQLPELNDPASLLQPHERKAWNDEVARLVNLQELREGLEIEFPPARDLPTRFRVRKQRGASNRVDDYILESLEPPPGRDAPGESPAATDPASRPAAGAGWPQEFLGEVESVVNGLHADKEFWPGLLYVREELGELVREAPRDLAYQLLLAFVAVRYLSAGASPDQHRRALTYYEIALDALDARLLPLLHGAPPTLMERLGGLLSFFRHARDAKR